MEICIAVFLINSFFWNKKPGPLMVLPIVNIKNFVLNEVKYHPKENIKEIKMAALTNYLKIKFMDGSDAVYHTFSTGNSPSDIQKIISMLNS